MLLVPVSLVGALFFHYYINSFKKKRLPLEEEEEETTIEYPPVAPVGRFQWMKARLSPDPPKSRMVQTNGGFLSCLSLEDSFFKESRDYDE